MLKPTEKDDDADEFSPVGKVCIMIMWVAFMIFIIIVLACGAKAAIDHSFLNSETRSNYGRGNVQINTGGTSVQCVNNHCTRTDSDGNVYQYNSF